MSESKEISHINVNELEWKRFDFEAVSFTLK